MRFYKNNESVGSAPPPEEILERFSGGFGVWQISILTVGFFSTLTTTVQTIAIRTGSPSNLNYTCQGGNGSQCTYANGTPCKEFVFDHTEMRTFTEKLLLVCDKGDYPTWVKACERVGSIIGTILTGVCADKFGLRAVALLIIPISTLTGLLMIHTTTYQLLLTFVTMSGFFNSALELFPIIAVCDSIGNKWRTLALGILTVSLPLSGLALTSFYKIFSEVEILIACAAVLPLVILLPLLYYEDSPNYVCLHLDVTKTEKILRKICRINKSTRMVYELRIRPVQLLIDSKTVEKSSFFALWKHVQLRKAYIALGCPFFFCGYYLSLTTKCVYLNLTVILTYGMFSTIGSGFAIILCHLMAHKYVLGIFSFLKNFCIMALVMNDIYWKAEIFSAFAVLISASGLLVHLIYTTLVNLIPRMIPTEMRGLCLGLYFSLFHLGFVLGTLLSHYTNDSHWVTGLFLFTSPILETLACFFLWSVHKRELPDFVMDCLKFQKYYKPTRYWAIDNADENEIEVKKVDLDR